MNLPALIALREQLALNGNCSMLVVKPANVSYLCSYPCRDSFLLVGAKECFYLTDFRYFEEASREIKGCKVIRVDRSLSVSVREICRRLKIRKLAFESDHLTMLFHSRLSEALGAYTGLLPLPGIVEELRRVKSAGELSRIRKAVFIAEEALRKASAMRLPGKSEKEVACELEFFMRGLGAEGAAFEIIVASGPNSSRPHHLTSERKILKNEPVLVDIGADFRGYKSDLTRVFFSGKITPLEAKVYEIVLTAQKKALAAAAAGIAAKEVDSAARDHIEERGYGGFFGHSLGHGVGLDVHELPRVSQSESGWLLPGMVFTVEPAVYLPGKFGIRIEDMVLITGKGVEVLSGDLDK
ncbi:MAG: aminopeptidase P family protein [Candidatus Omnitrophota bacterium]|jgi:Xaa-Pro aminopeptidase